MEKNIPAGNQNHEFGKTETKLVQASIPADVADEFSIVAIKMGKNKKEILEGSIKKTISDFYKGDSYV